MEAFMDGYIPEFCVWEITRKCNLRCLHCGSAAGEPRENELTMEECFGVADQLVELLQAFFSKRIVAKV